MSVVVAADAEHSLSKLNRCGQETVISYVVSLFNSVFATHNT
jgi:hypothetical protein